MVGGDWSNSRYSALHQINRRNVHRLGVAWIAEKFEEGGTSRVTPVIQRGLMFVTAGRQVYALNATTGAKVWASANGLPNNRGVGVGQGLVFVGQRGGSLVALRQSTGALVWNRQTGMDQPVAGQLAAVAPTYRNGYVFTGLSDGDHNLRGRLAALDASTGKEIWQRFTIPGRGEPGHESWPAFNDAWKFGGGGVWTNPAVDPELGIAYFTTGNAVPAYAGDWRPGDNLYTCSVLAVDIKTGELKWHYQLVRHDVFEADIGVPVLLYNTRMAGKDRRALAVLRADGFVFQLDRETGKPLFPVEERPVPQLASQNTAATQPFPINGESVLMSCEDWKKQQIPAGFALGCMWTPAAAPPPSTDPQNLLAPFPSAKGTLMAYSPQTGYLYVQAPSVLHWPRRAQDPYFLNWNGVVPGLKAFGSLTAIDARTGRIAWKKSVPAIHRASGPPLTAGIMSGAPLVTAGGLLFRSSADGNVEAYDAKNGELLWQAQTGRLGANGPPATYEVGGEQFIALSMGTEIWAFSLGGKVPVTAQPVDVKDEDFSGPLTDTSQIETTSLHRSVVEPGVRYFIDEFTFNPYRARVSPGTRVLFVNNGNMSHEITALDGSWSTGPLSPTQQASILFPEPGAYTFICKDHPWSYGQIVVTAGTSSSDQRTADAKTGKQQFDENCSVCHGTDLGGRAAAPALLGVVFKSRWARATGGELLARIRTTMPPASPGGLDDRSYKNIATYLLQANELGALP
jgi:outer membrane protein assembly factor BamB/plastocyanin